jgi:carbonic anhydrase
MNAQTKETQQALSPKSATNLLKQGNKRFVENKKENRDLLTQVSQTSTGQFPFAAVLSCIDSRVPVELVFDQGIGDVFSVRVAGNIVNEDVLGSLEYSCKVAGSKVIVVMGHTACGAVNAACKGVELGNITPLLHKIKPAIASIKSKSPEGTDLNPDEVADENVRLSIQQIRSESPILAEMEANEEIQIIGASYHVSTGMVEFFN